VGISQYAYFKVMDENANDDDEEDGDGEEESDQDPEEEEELKDKESEVVMGSNNGFKIYQTTNNFELFLSNNSNNSNNIFRICIFRSLHI
jgi:hypothetical protein